MWFDLGGDASLVVGVVTVRVVTYANYAQTIVQAGLFLPIQDQTKIFGLEIKDRTASGPVPNFL